MIDLPRAILVVDDEVDVRMVLQRILQRLLSDHDILAVADGVAALTLLGERAITLVFTNHLMLGMSGEQLVHRIKAQWPTMRIVMVSGMEAQRLIRLGRALGLNGVLTKPFTIEQVRTLLGTVLP
jgi:CheY-like chemotaxis protein